MPICPNCRLEYDEGVATCPDCGCDLNQFEFEIQAEGDKDENQSDTANDDYIEIARFQSRKQVESIIKEFRSKGIPAMFNSSPDSEIQNYMFSLMVSLDYAAEADYEGEVILGEEWQKYKLMGLSD